MKQFQSIGEIVSALWRKRWIIVLVIILGCAASVQYALGQPKLYQAFAVVQKEEARVSGEAPSASTPAERVFEVRLIEQRLMARDSLLALMDRHGLFADTPDVPLNERIFTLRQSISIQGIINEARAYLPGGAQPSGILVSVTYSDPVSAAALANDLVQQVVEVSSTIAVESAQETLAFYTAEEQRLDAQILSLDARIAEFKRAHSDALPTAIADLRTELAGLRGDSLNYNQEILTLEATSDRMRAEVKARELAILMEQKSLVEVRMRQLQALIDGAPDVERDLAMLERDMEQLQAQFESVTERKADAEIAEQLERARQSDRFEVLETALVPETSISGSRSKLAMMGGVASVMAALGIALGLEILNPRIRTTGQMQRMLGIQPVIAIPEITIASVAGVRRPWYARFSGRRTA